MTWYEVTTRIYDDKSTIKLTGTVEQEEQPQETCTSFAEYDEYKEYFPTRLDAKCYIIGFKAFER